MLSFLFAAGTVFTSFHSPKINKICKVPTLLQTVKLNTAVKINVAFILKAESPVSCVAHATAARHS